MRAFAGTLNWTSHWYHPEGPHSALEVAQQIADYAVAGLSICAPGAGRGTRAPTRATPSRRRRGS